MEIKDILNQIQQVLQADLDDETKLQVIILQLKKLEPEEVGLIDQIKELFA